MRFLHLAHSNFPRLCRAAAWNSSSVVCIAPNHSPFAMTPKLHLSFLPRPGLARRPQISIALPLSLSCWRRAALSFLCLPLSASTMSLLLWLQISHHLEVAQAVISFLQWEGEAMVPELLELLSSVLGQTFNENIARTPTSISCFSQLQVRQLLGRPITGAVAIQGHS